MYDFQFIVSLLIIGVLIYSALLHGLVFFRMAHLRVEGTFSLLCFSMAAYASTNITALYLVSDVSSYILTSKISSIFVCFSIFFMACFTAEYLQDKSNIPIKLILMALTPFFIMNLFMSNGILWSSIEGIELVARPLGNQVMRPINPVVSWPMYGLWAVVATTYLLIIRASFLAVRHRQRNREILLLVGLIVLIGGFTFDMLIDLGINNSYLYISEYLILIFVVLMSLYLTDQMRLNTLNLERQITERTSALQQANQELESFSYSISHDLRAPLRTILGFSKALQQQDMNQSASKDCRDHIDRIISSAVRMQSMIQCLLDLSKVARGDLNKEEINISALAEDILAEFKENDPDRQVSINIESDLIVNADPLLIRLLLENLLENAWKYTSRTKAARISVSRAQSNQYRYCFEISDNGIGFSPEHAERLFTPFQRLHTDDNYPGIGIGLATVKRIIMRHNGDIKAEGHEGTGALFKVYLN